MRKTSNNPSAEADPNLQSGRGKSPGTGCLIILATPIGHAKDISLRALEVLAESDLILAEDTRVTAKLLAIHGIARPLAPYNDHNAAEVRPRILQKLQQGARIALVSDAGTPLVSDPGFKLVREAVRAEIAVTAVPGASAALAALALSALPTDRFLFAGFLPSKPGERARALEDLRPIDASLIFFESAQRLGESLAAMAEVLGPRPAAVARELTKLHEEVRRGSLAELAAHYKAQGAPKGEITLVVGPPPEATPDFAAIDTALKAALAYMPVKAAAELVAGLSGVSRKTAYDRALIIKND